MNESKSNTEHWKERARVLHDDGGVPRQRANVVALREQGYTFSEIASELGFGSDNEDRSQVHHHLGMYQEQRQNAKWILENGPDFLGEE